jgi:hypothetical protein
MYLNQKPSESVSVLATLDPASVAASTVLTPYAPIKNHFAMLALIDVGAFGASATVDVKLCQAQDATGTNVKNITGKAITQLVAAGGNNRQALINMKAADLDTEGGFAFVSVSVTVGTSTAIISVALLGFLAHYEDAALFNQAGVAQVV